MQAGKFYREHHDMVTPNIANREGGPKYLFGRGRGEHVILCTSDLVSRNHCEVYFRNGAFWIKDLKSLNGTYLNEVKIVPNIERELRFGDRIGLGVSITNTDIDPTDQLCYTFEFKRSATRMFMGKNVDAPTPRQTLVVTTRRRIAPNSNNETNRRRLQYRRRRPAGGSYGQIDGHQRRPFSRRHQLAQLNAILGNLIFLHRLQQQRLAQELADLAVQVRRTERQRDMLIKMLRNLKKQKRRTKKPGLVDKGPRVPSCKAGLQTIAIRHSGGENDSHTRSVDSLNNSDNVSPTESINRGNGLDVLAQAASVMSLWEWANENMPPAPTIGTFAQTISTEDILSAANPFFSRARPVSPDPSNPPSVPDISNSINDEEYDSFFD